MDGEKDLFDLFDGAKSTSLDELLEDELVENSQDGVGTDVADDETPYSYDEGHEYYIEEDNEEEDEEQDDFSDEVIEIGDFINVGDILTFGDEDEEDFSIEMKCVFKTWHENNVYVLFHPIEAPVDSQFVPMRIELDEENNQIFSPVTMEMIAEQILQMYRNEER